ERLLGGQVPEGEDTDEVVAAPPGEALAKLTQDGLRRPRNQESLRREGLYVGGPELLASIPEPHVVEALEPPRQGGRRLRASLGVRLRHVPVPDGPVQR